MSKSLESLFQEANWHPIEVFGRETVGIYSRTVSAGSILRFTRLKSSSIVTQGLRIDTSKRVFEIDSKRFKSMIHWADTDADEVQITISGKSDALVKFWNVWSEDVGGHQVTQAWSRNAAMQVTEEGNSVLLECSDGVGEVDFSDLVVRLTFIEPHS
jgi:hypothetical protein